MKKYASTITLLAVLLATYWSFRVLMPSYSEDSNLPDTNFSTDRALQHVQALSQEPHAVGFPAHKEVRQYILSELRKMGLETTTQEGYTVGRDNNFCKVTNILARIKGTEPGKSLLLLSHYDSDPHSSLGASDAGSGVATILEGARASLAKKKRLKNDVILLISDGEEIDLSGAELFMDNHPWAKDVGLVLNFEARGSGGPSYVFLETNRGNQNLIRQFMEADAEYPMANSLYYSIYKLLPNDTDLTVFREKGDIEGFNFAFIDDHFDYHTVRDNYKRLDRSTLTHQGTYLMPLIEHFGNTDLDNLKSLNDLVYFNVPFFGLVSYPFEWIWPMFILATLFFIILLIYGFRKKVLNVVEITKGFIPLTLCLVINGLVGQYSWPFLKWIYPHYGDMLHGFTYNGYSYIAAFVLFSMSSCFWIYHRFKKLHPKNLLVAPILVWLIICWVVSTYLQGAAFFIVPVFALLASFLILMDKRTPNLYLLFFLTLPALWIYAPFIKAFPVGLGLKMMVSSTILATLTFFLLLPLFGLHTKKKRLASIGVVLFFGFLVAAHLDSGFSQEKPKPTSLLYILDTDNNSAKWATYEKNISDWTSQYLDNTRVIPETLAQKTLSSKYSSGFTFVSNAPLKPIPPPKAEITLDTIINGNRTLEICISSQRPVNRLEVFTNNLPIFDAAVNRIPLSSYSLERRKGGRLITHYISDKDDTELLLTIPKDSVLELTLYEASNDLLKNPQFTIPQRPQHTIPMPFVLNDAILTINTLKIE